MINKTIIFAGTTEGRELAKLLADAKIPVLVSTATEYGESLLEQGNYLESRSGRLEAEEMAELILVHKPAVLVDATHPFAQEVTDNIIAASKQTNVPYIRLKRQEIAFDDNEKGESCIFAETMQEAVSYLKRTTGNILSTIGSKELHLFTEIPNYENRIYARVLSLPSVVAECGELGLTGRHLLAMQGPFSVEMNYAMIHQTDASILVTKESGRSGGYVEKLQAAKRAGIPVLVIGRPKSDYGDTMETVLHKLGEFYPEFKPEKLQEQKITLVGVGLGNHLLLTREASLKIASADLFIGSNRMIESLQNWKNMEFGPEKKTDSFCSYRPEEIANFINLHTEYSNVVIALSGDAGFYSGAKNLLSVLPESVEVFPGISSLSYFAAKLHTSWDDAYCISLHGRKDPVLASLRKHQKVFAILGSSEDVRDICRLLIDFDIKGIKISVGENLSYESEQIRTGAPEDFINESIQPLSVCMIEQKERPRRSVSYGIEDEEFIREKVPMTKQEVRSVILSKLRLDIDSVLYDIGAGTGSVSVEAARLFQNGMVYAIEKNPEAVSLLKQNRKKFIAERMQIIEGRAPEILGFLPEPTHAFIGGSTGGLKEILQLLWSKNPNVRIVATAVTIETTMEILQLQETDPRIHCEMTQISVTRMKPTGIYRMMRAQNPVNLFVITRESC
ncbi:MAG: precorrin-6A reductase [Lachnospiraceae bacterium]